MALSAAAFNSLKHRQRVATQVKSAAVMYQGSFAGLGAAYDATAANVGRTFPYNDQASIIYWGLCQGGGGSGASQGQRSVTGDASYEQMVSLIQEAFIIEKVAVTGATGPTDVGRYVYLTDDGTLTLTRPSVGCPLGVVAAHRSSTSCDVSIFAVETVIAIVAGGAGKLRMCLGTFLCADMANGDLVTSLPMNHQGAIVQFHAIVTKAPAGTGGTVTINLEIGTTNVGPTTPASLVVATGDAKGAAKASAAISANNVFHEGDLLSVEAASVTTMSAGSFTLWMDYLTGPGI